MIAKIMPLKEGGKDYYTQAKDHKSISLSPTLHKHLEAVLTWRFVRSSIHALLFLHRQVCNVGRAKKTVISLVRCQGEGIQQWGYKPLRLSGHGREESPTSQVSESLNPVLIGGHVCCSEDTHQMSTRYLNQECLEDLHLYISPSFSSIRLGSI